MDDISKTNNGVTTTTPRDANGQPEGLITSGKINDKPPIVKVGKRNLSAVFLSLTEEEKAAGKVAGKDNIVSFTDQEAFILNIFLSTKDYEATAKECGIKVASVKRILRRENLKRYLRELIEKAAVKSGTDKDWLLLSLRKTAEGIITPTDTQMKAFKYISDILVPKGAGVVVNQQQNNLYGNLDKGQVDAEFIKARSISVS